MRPITETMLLSCSDVFVGTLSTTSWEPSSSVMQEADISGADIQTANSHQDNMDG